MKQSTDTASALNLARSQAFTTANGVRDGKKIAIVITDGCSNDRNATVKMAKQLTDSGVLILALGVGNIDLDELKLIASLPEDVYAVDSYKVLNIIQDEIANRTNKLGKLFRRIFLSSYHFHMLGLQLKMSLQFKQRPLLGRELCCTKQTNTAPQITREEYSIM